VPLRGAGITRAWMLRRCGRGCLRGRPEVRRRQELPEAGSRGGQGGDRGSVRAYCEGEGGVLRQFALIGGPAWATPAGMIAKMSAEHPIISSLEPGEDWGWSVIDHIEVNV
jgi:hypothetical protein